MNRPTLAVCLFVALAAFAPSPALAQSEPMMKPSYGLLRQSLAARSPDLRTSIAVDSTYVGHSRTNHNVGGNNPWNIYVGTARPGPDPANNALWDFDNQTGIATPDSMQGWWPMVTPYRYAPYSNMTDDQRPWFLLDYGNQLNYRPIHGRTYGVTSAWHADPGNAAGHVAWAPLAGTHSMWCGLRQLNDNSVIDPWTGQPYNEQAVQFNTYGSNAAAAPIYRNYPGYGNQWDQILYRDFPATSGNSMNIQFLYRTRMSTSYSTAVTTRTGWFHGDPLAMTAGNFISASAAGTNAPRDSFSVYIGVPVDDASCHYSNNTVAPVFDLQRRWFDEVIRFDAPYFEILGQAGANPADTNAVAVSVNQTIPWANPGNGNAYIGALYNSPLNPSHLVRLAFRVKTNRTYSDDDYASGSGVMGNGFTSNGRGAVLLDNVVVDGNLSDFEGANGGVDNALDGSGHWVTPTTASWKATGKPVSQYCHPENILTEVHWSDVCGGPHAATSLCDLNGVVVSIGNADQNGSIADPRYPSMTESLYGIMSPTIDLVTNPDGVTPNEMGITGNMKLGTDDYYLYYELNYAAFNFANTGTMWYYGVQCYPALTANGHYAWSDLTGAPVWFYQNHDGCEPDLEWIKSNSMLHTSNASGIPDSLRLYLGIRSECFYFGGTCNSTAGGYFDDIALVLANKTGTVDPVGSVTSDIFQFFNDAFPVNGYAADNVAAGTAGFDTTTALVKGAFNMAATTGDLTRPDVLADSVLVAAPNGDGGTAPVRVDLVFRILPGPGNYQLAAGRAFPPTSSMKLLKVPTDQSQIAASGDGTFWGEFMANPGPFSSPGAHAGGRWDPLAWNSARCDTVDMCFFPAGGFAPHVDFQGNHYQSTYHESDPHYEKLGIQRAICYLIDPNNYAYSSNYSCDSTWNKIPGHLLGNWELAAGTGFPSTPGLRWSTREFTKIIPDGLLTPGSHVEYFFRKSRIDGTGGFAMDPDTTTISPQVSENNFDGHRWQQFGVLPDRWKGTEFGGSGMACMLYIDNDDRLGDECAWVSVMDSIGGTAPNRWGSHNGWHAPGAGFGLSASSNPAIAAAYVNRNSQPGTAWDMYGVKGSESGSSVGTRIGNRYAVQPGGLMAGKGAAIGPRKEWLRTYYRMIAWLTGDGSTLNIGPVVDAGENDIALIEDWLSTPAGTPQPRQLLVQGDGFAEQCTTDGGSQLDFLNNWLFATLRDASYIHVSGHLSACVDLASDPAIVPDGTVFGVVGTCTTSNDVLTASGSEATAIANYQPVGVGAPYVASVRHAATAGHNWQSILDGWDIVNTTSRYCATSNGRLAYYYDLMVNGFGSLCGNWSSNLTLDVPNNGRGTPYVNFMKVGNSVLRSSQATVSFGVAEGGRVRIRLYDVVGRVVRTLCDRTYDAGTHSAVWDGRDDTGAAVPRGVYFARIEYAGGGAINGRVVVLR